MPDRPLNCFISVIVASKVLAMSIAPSSVRVASWLSKFSCILACLMPTVSCSINLSSVSMASLKLHFFACNLYEVQITIVSRCWA